MLTLVGADGSGKTTLARRIQASARISTKYMYMGSNPSAATHRLPPLRLWHWIKDRVGAQSHRPGPPLPARPTRPSSAALRLARHLKSLAAASARVLEDALRLLVAEWWRRRGHLVIMDRHPFADYYTRRVAPVASDHAWQRWGDRLHGRVLRHLYPRPDGLVVLDAPARVLHQRKPEGSLVAVEARRREYLEVARHVDGARVLDVDRPADEVLADLLRIVDESVLPDRRSRRAAAGAEPARSRPA